MTKDTVAEWSTTASLNTDVGGIEIAEGAPAKNWNNAVREIMAQVRAAQIDTSSGTVAIADLSEDPDDAEANSTAIQNAMDEASASLSTLVLPRMKIPIATSLVIPAAGNFTMVQLEGGELRPVADMTSGCFRQADRATAIPRIKFHGVTVRFSENSVTGNPYMGNGFNIYVNRSILLNCRVPRYYGEVGQGSAQAFLVGADQSLIINPHFYTDTTNANTGGFRFFRGVDTIIMGAHGTSGDDSLQFVPISSANIYDYSILRCAYIGGRVRSTRSRPIVAVLDNGDGVDIPATTGDIKDCAFIGIEGRSGGLVDAGGWAFSLEGRGDGEINNMLVANCQFDARDSEGFNDDGIYIRGRVKNTRIHCGLTHYPSRIARVTTYGGVAPENLTLEITAKEPAEQTVEHGVEIEAGTRVVVRNSTIPSPTGKNAIHISGGSNHVIKDNYITGIASGEVGVNVLTATNVTLDGNAFTQGSTAGTPVNWDATSAATGVERRQNLGGMTRAGTRPSFLDPQERWVSKHTINFDPVAANTENTTTVTVTGVTATNSHVTVTPNFNTAGIIYTGYVSAADTVTIKALNVTTGSVNPAEGDFTVIVTKEQP